MTWRILPAREAFPEFLDYWNAINAELADHVLLDASFVGLLVEHFATSRTKLAVSMDKSERAALLLEPMGRGTWQTFQPPQSPLGLAIFARAEQVPAQAHDLMRLLPSYAVAISVMQQDPAFGFLPSLPTRVQIELVPHIDTGRVAVTGDFASYWRARPRDLTDNLARRLRRLDREKIAWEFVIERRPDAVERCLEEYSRLECQGWKAKAGTAVTADGVQGSFYRRALEYFCQHREGVVFELRFNGLTVASQLGVERAGMLVLLKMAYDESVSSYAPGYLLRHEVLRECFANGQTRVVEFYGRARAGWTDKWTAEIRRMQHVTFYRNRWVPRARQVVKRTQTWLTAARARCAGGQASSKPSENSAA